MLDDYSIRKIIKLNKHNHIEKLLNTKCHISNYDLDWITFYGKIKIFDKVLEYKNISYMIKRRIAFKGFHRHRMKLIKNHTLNRCIVNTILRFGNEKHMIELRNRGWPC